MYVRSGRLSLLSLFGGVGIALALAACGSSSSSSSSSSGSPTGSSGNKVGYISVAPVSAGDWEQSNWAGLTAAAKKYHLKVSNQENVAYDQAASVLARMAPSNNLVIADSSGYEAAVLQVAPRFPKTTFVVVSDLSTTKGLKNVAGWAANWNQLGYLAGSAGCLAAKTAGEPTVGHVNSEPIPAFTRFAAGVKDSTAANSCKFLTSWTNSFTDTAAAKQAAATMIGKGAGAITSTADTGDQGSQAAASAENKPFVGDYAPIPKSLTSVLIHFNDAYDQIGKLWAAHQLKPQIYPMNVQNGMLSYDTPFSGPGAEVSPQALAIEQKIKSGELKVDATHQVKP
jgi:basic membrane protein A